MAGGGLVSIVKRMVRLIDAGEFCTFKASGSQLFIMLGKKEFAWVNVAGGDMLVSSHGPRRDRHSISHGQFRLYEVHGEPDLIDEIHLELHNSKRRWRGYLLPHGLPRRKYRQTPIEPTPELISIPIS